MWRPMRASDRYTCQCALTGTTAACDASTTRIADGTNRPRPANPTSPGKSTCYITMIINIAIAEPPFVVVFSDSCRTWPTHREACAKVQWLTRDWPWRSARAYISVVSWKCRKCWKCTRLPGTITARRRDGTWSRSGKLNNNIIYDSWWSLLYNHHHHHNNNNNNSTSFIIQTTAAGGDEEILRRN